MTIKLLTNYFIKMNNARIEKKFVLGKSKEDYLESILIRSGFNRIFKPRYINSIYLDTVNFDFAKDNINGVSQRKKIRFRWYNNDLNNISIEEKNKKNFNVWKKINKLNLKFNKQEIIEHLKKKIFDLHLQNNNFNYKFVLKTNYNRSYWILNNKKIRATIDINISTSPANNLSRHLNLNETILEFKFDPINEAFFRNFFNKKISFLRANKYSKYVRSFIELENSGLIN